MSQVDLPASKPDPKTAAAENGSAKVASPEPAAQARQEDTPRIPRPVFERSGPVTGQPITRASLFAPGGEAQPEGRRIPLTPASATALAACQPGESILLPLPDGDRAGTVNLTQDEETGWRSVAGTLDGGGSFALGIMGREIGGTILLPRERRAYEFRMEAGQPIVVERRLADLVCLPLPRALTAEAASVVSSQPAAARAAVPVFSSRPTATAVLYLDFDGATVTDPVWNGGKTIVAPASTLSNTAITEVWNRVKEDFWPFNVDVTTDPSRYDSAPVGRRMRCIVTSNDVASPDAGGVAWINSFDRAGRSGYGSSTVPCWVFNQGSAKTCADTISHELGHTLGLRHDGNSNATTTGDREYYAGHGSGTTGWGPIMGAPYGKTLTQWSKGEYSGANNREDDVTIIANSANGFGYVADEAGETPAKAAKLTRSGSNAVEQDGIITKADDVDVYKFTCAGNGTVRLTVAPADVGPNADLQLELLAGSGAVLASNNPATALNATVSQTVSAGTYYVRITTVGKDSAATTGYSKYGSVGAYRLSGTIPSEGFDVGGALEAEDLVWSTTGEPTWVAQKTESHDGQDAAQVSNVAAGGKADLSAGIDGPVDLSFWWRASSTPNVDFVVLLIDGKERLRLSGESDWEFASVPLASGSHTVTWRYQRRADSTSTGQNSAWVDSVVLSPLAPTSGADRLADATPIHGRIFRATSDTSSASSEVGEPAHASQGAGDSLWWKWTAPAGGVVTASTAGSGIATVVAVYQQKAGATLGSFADLTPVASAGSSGRAPQAMARFTAEAGQTYAIAVAGAHGARGAVRLTLAYTNPSTFAGILTAPNAATAPGLITFSVTRDLRFTAQARVGAATRTFKGELPSEAPGQAGKVFGGVLSITSAQALGSDHLTGSLYVNGQTYRYTAAAALAPTELPASTYNFVAGMADFRPDVPGGLSYAHLEVKQSRMKAVGTAGDGSKFSAGGVVTVDRSWPLWARGTRVGTLAGDVFFDQQGLALSGQLNWVRSMNSRRSSYPNALGLSVGLTGHRYESYQEIFATSSAAVSFAGDDTLELPADRTITLTSQGKTASEAGLPFSLTFIGTTGLFHGTTIHPATGKKVTFGGASLNSLHCAAGVVALPTGSARIVLTP